MKKNCNNIVTNKKKLGIIKYYLYIVSNIIRKQNVI